MSLMSNVLRIAAVDLLFFGIVFFNSLIAFSMMLYVQLGPVMEDFYANHHAAISLFRALFGDFDIDEIMDNSAGYTNAALFLGYLFVAIFICLSLFLAILAEAQGIVREEEKRRMESDPTFNEFGIVASAWHGVQWAGHRILHPLGGGADVPSAAADEAKDGDDEDDEPTLEEAVDTLRGEVGAIGAAVKELAGVVAELRTNPPEVLLPPLDATGGTGGGGGGGGGGPIGAIGVEEAKAMRMVVEALDSKLTHKLQQIDERLASRGKRPPDSASTGRTPRPSRPTPQRVATLGGGALGGALGGGVVEAEEVAVAVATPVGAYQRGSGDGAAPPAGGQQQPAPDTFAC